MRERRAKKPRNVSEVISELSRRGIELQTVGATLCHTSDVIFNKDLYQAVIDHQDELLQWVALGDWKASGPLIVSAMVN